MALHPLCDGMSRQRDRAFGVEKDRRLVGLLDEGVAVARRVSRLAEPANQCGAEQRSYFTPTYQATSYHLYCLGSKLLPD